MLVDVFFDGVDDVEAALRFDIACCCALAKRDAVHHMAGLGVDQFELDMLLMATHHLGGAIVVDIARKEQGLLVGRTVGSQLLQLVEQSLVDVVEVELHVDVQRLLRLFGHDMVADIFLETAAELGDVFLPERQSYGIGVTSEVLQQVAARLDGLVDVEACHRTRRAGGYAVDDGLCR